MKTDSNDRIPVWIRVVTILLSAFFIFFGVFIYASPETVFGPAGYNPLAKLPIHYSAAAFIAIGSMVGLTLWLNEVKVVFAGLVLVLVLGIQLPVLMFLNIGAFERIYDNLGIAIWWWASGYILLINMPTVLALLALNKLRK